MTPGQFRSHARYLRGAATEYRRMALATDVHFWKDKWIRDADKAEEDAAWYDEHAGFGEIEVEYIDLDKVKEAAE